MIKAESISDRMKHISPFYVMDILAQAKQLEAEGFDVIHLEVGEPDFTTPDAVKQAAKSAINQNRTFYTPATGLPELRLKISEYYQQRLSADVAAKNIVITPGASGALQLALSVIINSGQKVLMADPGYPCNRHFVRLLEATAVSIPVEADTGYQLTHKLIEENWDETTRAVLIASPSNPTGTLVDRQEMKKITDLVKRKNGVLIVDEIYQGLVYDQADFSALSLKNKSNNLFVINSFSKYFSMTGWRLGWLVVPDNYLNAVDRLAQNLFLAPPTISQYAALSAFENTNIALLDKRRDELKFRRDFMLAGLQTLGFDVNVKPGGAFYIYADISRFSLNSFAFCQQLLRRAHVAITPGIDFGEHHAGTHVRFAYTQNIDKLQQSLERIGDFLSSYKEKN